MKVMKTLVIGLGILLGCNCGKKVNAAVWNDINRTTEGTYLGSEKRPLALRGNYWNPKTQTWDRPGQGYYTE